MRRVVTGADIAQVRNPDPFAVPAWRSPVYRTPLAIVATVHAARLLARLVRLASRHPVMVLAVIAGVLMWRVIGWLGLAVLAGASRCAWRSGGGASGRRSPASLAPRLVLSGGFGITADGGPR